MQWVIRVSVVVVGVVGTALTFLDTSVLVFWILGADLSYTIMLPQLVCVLFFDVSNGYGAVAGYVVGASLRVLSGEPSVGLPPVLRFPGCTLENGVYVQYSPFKTICMLSALAAILCFSYLASQVFNRGLIADKWDVFKVKKQTSLRPTGDGKAEKKCEDKDTAYRASSEREHENEQLAVPEWTMNTRL